MTELRQAIEDLTQVLASTYGNEAIPSAWKPDRQRADDLADRLHPDIVEWIHLAEAAAGHDVYAGLSALDATEAAAAHAQLLGLQFDNPYSLVESSAEPGWTDAAEFDMWPIARDHTGALFVASPSLATSETPRVATILYGDVFYNRLEAASEIDSPGPPPARDRTDLPTLSQFARRIVANLEAGGVIPTGHDNTILLFNPPDM